MYKLFTEKETEWIENHKSLIEGIMLSPKPDYLTLNFEVTETANVEDKKHFGWLLIISLVVVHKDPLFCKIEFDKDYRTWADWTITIAGRSIKLFEGRMSGVTKTSPAMDLYRSITNELIGPYSLDKEFVAKIMELVSIARK